MLKRQSDRIEFLASVPLFQGMSRKDLTALARAAEVIDLEPGEVIVFENQAGSAAYVLVDAEAIVRRNRRKVAELGPGDVIGELALLSDLPRNATVVATAPGKALEIHRRHFMELIDTSPRLCRRISAQLADRLRATDRKLYG